MGDAFYDDLAARYHLLFDDWWAAVDDTGRILDGLLRAEGLASPSALLDCSSGIGTQALGLAARGWRVHGTDVSEPAVARARAEAAVRRLDATFAVADMRSLGDEVGGPYDAVLTFDNSLAHLLTDDDLAAALGSMRARLAPGGLLLASVRDYDALLASAGPAPLHHVQTGAERPRGTFPHTVDGDDGRRVIVQSWSWPGDGPLYDVDLFILEEADGGWTTGHWRTRSRAWLRAELQAAVADAGFADVRWSSAAESGYYQPVLRARQSA